MKYSEEQILEKLEELLELEHETEVVEFKEAKSSFHSERMGKYFSAISNEANLARQPEGWLVLGIKDNRKPVGTSFKKNSKSLQNLKKEIADHTTNNISFVQIYSLEYKGVRVVLFQIPAAPRGLPLAYKGHYYARESDSLGSLNIEKIERIRGQVISEDWSAKVIPDATIEDLDPVAVVFAREKYIQKFPKKAAEASTWDDITFLNKAKITKRGKITNTAILLLGKEESEVLISPAVCKIRWILRNEKGDQLDYDLFHCPLILQVDRVYQKIRNLKYRYMRSSSLFPDEVDQYDPYIVREAINNCIAHQDYALSGVINVVEMHDQLLFSNKGAFIPNSVEEVVVNNAPEEVYRNPFLAQAMFQVGMVDTAGGGIRKMFDAQTSKFFPLPDYDISADKVQVVITGKVLDMQYAQVLAQSPELSLMDIILLDKVQKQKPLDKTEVRQLKDKRLIEGRKPNYIISKRIAQDIGRKADYSIAKGFDNAYYKDLILKAIREHGVLTRKDIDELLWNKLPTTLDDKRKKNRIMNILSKLRLKGSIKNTGSRFKSSWVLTEEEKG